MVYFWIEILVYFWGEINKLTEEKRFKDKAEDWRLKSVQTYTSGYQEFLKNANNKEYYENTSLFYGFPGFIMSDLLWNKKIDNTWLECLFL